METLVKIIRSNKLLPIALLFSQHFLFLRLVHKDILRWASDLQMLLLDMLQLPILDVGQKASWSF